MFPLLASAFAHHGSQSPGQPLDVSLELQQQQWCLPSALALCLIGTFPVENGLQSPQVKGQCDQVDKRDFQSFSGKPLFHPTVVHDKATAKNFTAGGNKAKFLIDRNGRLVLSVNVQTKCLTIANAMTSQRFGLFQKQPSQALASEFLRHVHLFHFQCSSSVVASARSQKACNLSTDAQDVKLTFLCCRTAAAAVQVAWRQVRECVAALEHVLDLLAGKKGSVVLSPN